MSTLVRTMEATDVGRFGTLSLISQASSTITSFGIDNNPLTFGSDPTSTVRLFYPSIAPTHALIEFVESKAFLVIQGKGGVEIDGCRVKEGRVALGNGDSFTIQGKRFKFDYPPKALRRLMDPLSPVKCTGNKRRVRLSLVRAAVIDSPTPGAKIVQLGGGDAMFREEGVPEDLARQDSPFAMHQKSQSPPFIFQSSHSSLPIHSPTPRQPSLPEFSPSPLRPPSPQKDSLRGRVLVRRAMLAEEEQEELEVAGDEEMGTDSDGDEMMVDSEPEMVPESEADMEDDDQVVEIPTPKAFKFTRPSVGGRPSLIGGPPVRPERPTFKLDLSMPTTPIKEEEPVRKDLWTTPRRKKAILTTEEKKAIQERRKSALAAPDLFFAGRVPGLGPSMSPMKLFGVKEESAHRSVFASPSPTKITPLNFGTLSLASPIKTRPGIFGSSTIEATVEEESEDDDAHILLARMKEEMEIMRSRQSPKKDSLPKGEPMDVQPSTPCASPAKDVVAKGSVQSPIPTLDLRQLVSPRSSRPSTPMAVMDEPEPEQQEAPSAQKPPSKRRKTVDEPELPQRATRAKPVSTEKVEQQEKPVPKRKTSRAKKEIVEEALEEEEAPKKKATRSNKAAVEEPRTTRAKRAPTPSGQSRTRTRTKTVEIENEEPPKPESDVEVSHVEEPKKARQTRTRSKTEPIPEEIDVPVVKGRTRAKKEQVKQEPAETTLPRTRTRTRTRTAGK